jgi:hypothetical protein
MSALKTKFDHLVVAATTLELGVAWVQSRLGVTVPLGGKHDHMATHNCVGRLTDDTFLEIIAINPNDTPDRVRWFSMDEPSFRDRLNTEGAFLHHWVINSTNISQTLLAATHRVDEAMVMTRGDLQWQISMRDDGVLARDGIVPTIIEWPNGTHPAINMGSLDLELEAIHVGTTDVIGTLRDLEAINAASFCIVTKGAQNRVSAQFKQNGEILYL